MNRYNETIDRLIEGWRDEIFEKLRGWVSCCSPSLSALPAYLLNKALPVHGKNIPFYSKMFV